MPSETYPFTPLRSMSNTLELVSLGGVDITTLAFHRGLGEVVQEITL
jgi:hypothetical protein